MDRTQLYRLAADGLLFIHILFVAFVVGSLVLIWVGKFLDWRWVRNFWFRITHLGAIGFVILQTWLGRLCPLTIWEMQLRERAGDVTYKGSFIAHWLGELLYFDAPWWAFVVAYTLFGSAVAGSWWWVKPTRNNSNMP